MKKNNFDLERLCIIFGFEMVWFFFLLILSKNALNELEQSELFDLMEHDGKLYAMDNDSLYSVFDLYIVRYKKDYYLTNFQYQIFKSDRKFTVVTTEEERNHKNQIFASDVIAFHTLLKDEVIDEKISLLEAYSIIEEYSGEIDSYFPHEVVDKTYPLNENVCDSALSYIKNSSDSSEERKFSIHELYMIYKNGNIYLCTENDSYGFFSLATNSSSQLYFQLDKEEAKDNNTIGMNQIVRFDDYLDRFSATQDNDITLREAYQLIEVGLEIVGNPFQKENLNSLFSFTESQLKSTDTYLSSGKVFLDVYHKTEIPKVYSLDNLYVVTLFDGSYAIVDDWIYDDVLQVFRFRPISCSGKVGHEIILDASWFIEGFSVSSLNFGSSFHFVSLTSLISDPSNISKYGTAEYYYILLRDYLVIHCNTLDADFAHPLNALGEDAKLVKQVGDSLGLKLVYDSTTVL